jgi:hypothetical protein
MYRNLIPWSIFRRLNIHSALALAGVLGPLVLILGDLTASFSAQGYNLVQNSISSLALTSLGWLQTIGFLAMGLLVEIFVAGLLFNIRGIRGFRPSIGALVFFGFGLLLIGAFRTNPAGGPHTIEGTIHGVTAMFVFWIFPVGVLLIAPSLKNDRNWKTLFTYTVASGILGLALVIGVLFLKDRISWFGLYERILVANMIIWIEVAAVNLLRLTFRRQLRIILPETTGKELGEQS